MTINKEIAMFFTVEKTPTELLSSTDYNLWPNGIYSYVNAKATELAPLFEANDWRWHNKVPGDFEIITLFWTLIFSCLRQLERYPELDTTSGSSGRLLVEIERRPHGVSIGISLDDVLVQSLNEARR